LHLAREVVQARNPTPDHPRADTGWVVEPENVTSLSAARQIK
jgi:hypothetical protein